MPSRISPRLHARFYAIACLALLSAWLAPALLHAQTFDATNLHGPQDLGVPWLVHAGDDPAYAQPGYDDSQWTRFDPTTRVVRLFPNHPDVLWYRLHVKVEPSEAGLALAEWNLSSAFDIYVNGQRLISNGQVAPFHPHTYDARLLRVIPVDQITTGSLVIALRVHISPYEWDNDYAGFYPPNLTLGQELALSDHIWLTVISENALAWSNQLVGFGLGIVAIALYISQRRQWEYVYIFLQFLAAALLLPLSFYRLFHNLSPGWQLLREPLNLVALVSQILMYFAFLRQRIFRWIQALLVLAAVGAVLSAVGTVYGTVSEVVTLIAQLPLLTLLTGVIPVMLIIHWRRGNREAGILLIPSVFLSLNVYTNLVLFTLTRIPATTEIGTRFGMKLSHLHCGPLLTPLDSVANVLYILSLAVIMVLRSTRISRQQALLESELAAAREVQQVILPEQVENVPGFTIESAYQPAQQVGGDFFQILPTPDGGLLLVVGDVAGKGLPAAMLVSVIVGAIRAAAQYTADPAELLANLNDRLVGRAGDGFSTALAAQIAPDGTVTIANAGHLPPYLDGVEVTLPGALPLGVQVGLQYETCHIHLPHNSRLTFYSDGVVEAQNTDGELFGFERSRAVSTQPPAAIVEAAQQFGQQDDITVIAIARIAAAVSAA